MSQEVDDQLTKKIEDRDWRIIRPMWIEHVPPIPQPGVPPESSLADMPAISAALAPLPRRQFALINDDVDGVRQGVLHEGLFLLHKAAHILGATLLHVQNGMCTWSVSGAYQCSYFSAKAILWLLGISLIETDTVGNGLLDVWYTPERPRGREPSIRIFKFTGGKVPQGQVWSFLQRAIQKTEHFEDFLSTDFLEAICDIDPRQFARPRNDLHYENTVWYCDDLHVCTVMADFGRVASRELDPDAKDFLLILSFLLVHTAQEILSSLAVSSGIIRDEKKLIDTWLSQSFNSLYHDNAAILAEPSAQSTMTPPQT